MMRVINPLKSNGQEINDVTTDVRQIIHERRRRPSPSMQCVEPQAQPPENILYMEPNLEEVLIFTTL